MNQSKRRLDKRMAGVCQGFRCLDRDECHAYDDAIKASRFQHSSDSCQDVLNDELVTLQYRNRSGELELISAERAQELMRCSYTSKLLFQRTLLLRNYAFFGYSDCVMDGYQEFAGRSDKISASISPKVCIGHVESLDHVEDQPLGLFAMVDIAQLEFLGEYTGVLQVQSAHADHFDAYGVCYPSVYEGGDLYVSAAEYGNAIRCINHSFSPNARFVPMTHDGVLHIFCVRTRWLCRQNADLLILLVPVDAVHDRADHQGRANLRQLRNGLLEVDGHRPRGLLSSPNTTLAICCLSTLRSPRWPRSPPARSAAARSCPRPSARGCPCRQRPCRWCRTRRSRRPAGP